MGIVYTGPYADDINHDTHHEGYAARLWPDGTLTAALGGDAGWTGHIGLVGACDCGWRCERIHPPGDFDTPEHEAAAERDFESEHLAPLIEAAKRRSWPSWVARVAARADHIAQLVAGNQLDDANHILAAFRDDVEHRTAVLADLILDRDSAVIDDPRLAVPARTFNPISDDPVALPSPLTTPLSAPTPRPPHSR